jgi:hypothetical protein
MHKYNSIDIHKQSIAFPVPVSTNLTLAEWHYMEILCTKFQPNHSLNMGVTGRNLFIPINKVWLTELIFMILLLAEPLFVNTVYTEFHENLTV